ncbi:hypothetical protein A2716_04465 [candidate division WWE3 bacterium RIFCSPHIGHO2_01_FULL_40_23]|uniref:Glycerophosphoryl diester phosphodiesterase membrane domain-containing protein n=1 Tax=candidate division WWE3 bacterium RIFCSPLOWO2_01_FULL_41_18 TaxID=1802625 RepID=A0A1F4VD98_UNCKA|nr:MAG: hypothetical protein A2716_04465 [candidate division WWE3 bacterium RIFCSPHIGHO2_01_FULL_40_23]OGC55127.1 MAG: hypothetical protein A3A78_04075 [candidate division WWE3 bacterium RIFCSPLOWO2_01_FULL_41_18]
MKADYGKIINEAFRITFKNKWLWVFGLILAMGSSGGNFNIPDAPGSKTKDKDNRIETPGKVNDVYKRTFEDGLLKAGSVLGESTVSLREVGRRIPIYYWVVLGVFLLIAFVLVVGISIYARSYAYGSLVQGVDLENRGITADLSGMSKEGRRRAVEIVKLELLPMVLAFVDLFLLWVPMILVFMSEMSSGVKLFLGLVLLTLALVFLILLIIVSVSAGLGRIAVVLSDLSWRQAFKKGFYIFKKFFIDVVVMGIINCFTGFLFGLASCVILIPFMILIFIGIAGLALSPYAGVVLFPLFGIMIVALIILFTLISAIAKVFMESTWVLLYKQLIETEVPVG